MNTDTREPSIFTPPNLAATQELCVTCGEPIASPYCPSCGEKRASDRTHSLWEFIKDHVVESVMNFDGRVIRTMKLLLLKPGQLTREFMRGSRLPYLQPLQCFLLVNLVFFLWCSWSKDRIFDTQLAVHLGGMPYSTTAKALVQAKLAASHENANTYMARFDAIGTAQARSLVIVMVPALAALMGLLTIRRRRAPVVQHVVYALHTFAAVLVLLVALKYVVDVPLNYILRTSGVKPGVFGYDAPDSFAAMLVLMAYFSISARRSYDLSKFRSVLTAILAVPGLYAIVTFYRELLFFITFYST